MKAWKQNHTVTFSQAVTNLVIKDDAVRNKIIRCALIANMAIEKAMKESKIKN